MEKRIRLHKITNLITAIIIAVTGISLISCCIAICFSSADSPFSRETVGSYFKYVIIQAVALLESIIFGIAIKFSFPIEKGKLRAKPNILVTKKKLTEKLAKRDEILLRTDETIKLEKNLRKNINIGLFTLISFFGIGALLFSFLIEYSIDNAFEYVIKVSIFSIAMALICGALIYTRDILFNRSYKREIDAIKRLLIIANTDVPLSNEQEVKKNRHLCINATRVILIFSAIALTVLGILNGGISDVLDKAVKICSECIGLE